MLLTPADCERAQRNGSKFRRNWSDCQPAEPRWSSATATMRSSTKGRTRSLTRCARWWIKCAWTRDNERMAATQTASIDVGFIEAVRAKLAAAKVEHFINGKF